MIFHYYKVVTSNFDLVFIEYSLVSLKAKPFNKKIFGAVYKGNLLNWIGDIENQSVYN